MNTHGLGGADGAKKHIAVAEQLLSAGHIENCARIHLRRNGQCDPARDIRLDDAGDNINRRALCGDHQVHSCRARICAKRQMESSTSLGAAIIRSDNSSIKITTLGSGLFSGSFLQSLL